MLSIYDRAIALAMLGAQRILYSVLSLKLHWNVVYTNDIEWVYKEIRARWLASHQYPIHEIPLCVTLCPKVTKWRAS